MTRPDMTDPMDVLGHICLMWERNDPDLDIFMAEVAVEYTPRFFAFTLTMPSNNAWNGKWSGDDKLYVLIKKRTIQDDIERLRAVSGKSYTYPFGDGWVAEVSVEEVDSDKAAKLIEKSDGFAGYSWMIDSIIDNGRILVGA